MSDSWPIGADDQQLSALQERYAPSLAEVDVPGLLTDPSIGNCAIVSSFGAESAVLLHYVYNIRNTTAVIFLDTHMHFPETIEYMHKLSEFLDLNLIVARPNEKTVQQEDPLGDLHGTNPHGCCTIRKTFPLQDALIGFDTWISGRKRYQGGERSSLPLVERDGEKLKVNPLAYWTPDDIEQYFVEHDLPRHPLQPMGYPSIGCAPCTRRLPDGSDDLRAGRWAQFPDKTECGIHLGPDGRFVRNS